MQVLSVLAAIGMVTLPIYAQEDVKTTPEDAALEALVTAIRELATVDSLWRLDPEVVVGFGASGTDAYSRDSATVARVLGRPVRTFSDMDRANGCAISRSGEKLSGCDREGGTQLLAIHRSGSHRTLANFMVYISHVGPKAAPSEQGGRSWRVVLEKQADGSYKLKRPPMLLLAH